MPEKAFVIRESKRGYSAKDLLVFEKPETLRPLLSRLGWRILQAFAGEPKYPAQVAKELRVYRQKVYYYVRQLERAGLIRVSRTKEIAGGIAKFYVAAAPVIGVELPFGGERLTSLKRMEEPLQAFWRPFVVEGRFEGLFVVGSPEPHGPNRTVARDGHYAIQLGFFLGQYCQLPANFLVKLDVDVKTEKAERNNLVVIGGPGTNLLSADVNLRLPVHFDERNYWAGLDAGLGRRFSGDADGIVAKIPNPFDASKSIVVLAGNRHVGTKAAIIAATRSWPEVLKGYRGEATWARVIRGFDFDGDGKVDSVEVLT